MLDLTFGEQVKLILSRRGMTIKELAETIEIRTGKKMSRQNLTQRLGRDNFQEQDMRMIAEILDCPFQLSILGEDGATTEKIQNRPAEPVYEKEPEAAAEEAEKSRKLQSRNIQKSRSTQRSRKKRRREILPSENWWISTKSLTPGSRNRKRRRTVRKKRRNTAGVLI